MTSGPDNGAPKPWEDPHEQLRNRIDRIRILSRAYKNGLVQKRSLEERREWARSAADAIDFLADELLKLLPPESSGAMSSRMGKENERRRREGNDAPLEFPGRDRKDKSDDRH